MALTLRSVKGSELTWNELDDNFTFLEDDTRFYEGSGDSSAVLRSSDLLNQSTSSGIYSIASGYITDVGGDYAAGFGYDNTVTGNYSVVGGRTNSASGEHSFIFGLDNTTASTYTFCAGQSNDISTSSNWSYVFGNNNEVLAGSNYSTIIGGNINTISASQNTSGIFSSNQSTMTANNSVILGGISITATKDETAYVPNLEVTGTTVNMSNLPTVITGLSAGDVWNDNGVLSIVTL